MFGYQSGPCKGNGTGFNLGGRESILGAGNSESARVPVGNAWAVRLAIDSARA